MKALSHALVALLLWSAQTTAQGAFEVDTAAQLWLPDLVSTPNSAVRITFSPDGTRMLWGAIGWSAGAGGWDIYESERSPEGWSAPKSVPFNSDANDFDPSLRRTARVSIFSPIARAEGSARRTCCWAGRL